MDVLTLRNLHLFCVIGCHPEERQAKRELLLTVAFHTDIRSAAKTDNLSQTIDYGELARQLQDTAAATRFQLIESLAETLAAVCLRHPLVRAVDLHLEKPGVPNGADAACLDIHRCASH